ncbi:MAG: hypothetical protein UW63_C0043G0023 [Candidatus Uhrbacteria bacterium GW2011_GWF2_44_350]|uniref:Phosphoglycerate mutase n=1 Tax=Candidatus Uhrbacteria bacterium GW2011_GWF2_44_350 TaxID=1619000 RepID=A0A0G1JEV3_9BACT|nr:MAG: hypothetical protein UW63_C0043G0023 [Candidatus Uhrbacteria bacterium GW2011_GWF2_44_350]HBR80643.1 hypothetical protein [Candidatus Uhrbacteria bacterium]HCU32193.1 hypothetical protein [Candidatus Uhrbacteria bacterium]
MNYNFTDSVLLVIRHGEFDKFGRMTEDSFKQALSFGQTHLSNITLAGVVISEKIRTLITAATICRGGGAQTDSGFCSLHDSGSDDIAQIKTELIKICLQIIDKNKKGVGGNLLMVTHLPILIAINKEAGGNSALVFPPLSGLMINLDPLSGKFTIIERMC